MHTLGKDDCYKMLDSNLFMGYSLIVRKQSLLYSVFAVFSLCVYYLAPQTYNWYFCMFCGLLYVVNSYLYISSQKKRNFFDFETIFLISYFFCFFAYPIFIYNIDPEYFFIFSYDFDHGKICQGTALALLGIQFFFLGCQSVGIETSVCDKCKKILPVKIFHFITMALFLGFIVLGGYQYFEDLYSGDGSEGGIFVYFLILYVAFYILSVVSEFNNMLVLNERKIGRLDKTFVVFCIFVVLLLLTTGTRTLVLQMLLSFIGLYSMFISPINLRRFLLLASCGAVVLSIISFIRVNREVALNSVWDVFMDLIINNRSTYFALSYVDEHGISWGGSMLGYLLKPIPFSQGIVCNLLGLDPAKTTSAMLITVETLGANPDFGLGTNIIADLYLGFGLLGVVVFMFLLGRISKKAYIWANAGRVYGMLIYTILLSLAIYTVRSEYFYGLNLLLWTFIITNCMLGLMQRNLFIMKRI